MWKTLSLDIGQREENNKSSILYRCRSVPDTNLKSTSNYWPKFPIDYTPIVLFKLDNVNEIVSRINSDDEYWNDYPEEVTLLADPNNIYVGGGQIADVLVLQDGTKHGFAYDHKIATHVFTPFRGDVAPDWYLNVPAPPTPKKSKPKLGMPPSTENELEKALREITESMKMVTPTIKYVPIGDSLNSSSFNETISVTNPDYTP